MRLRVFFFFCLVLAVLPLAGEAGASGFSILTPIDNSYIESNTADLVISVSDREIDGFGIEINGKAVSGVKTPAKNNMVCSIIDLSPGLNRLKITAFKGQSEAEQKEIRLYVKSPFSQDVLPAGIAGYKFHKDANEKKCFICHQMNPDKNDLEPSSPEASSCYMCHKRMLQEKYVHGPAALWNCLSCHDANSKKGKYQALQPASVSCYPCHKTEMDAWKKSKFEHGPFTLGDCTICHKPHASDYPYWLRMHTTDLCLTCHSDKASGAHVVSGFFTGGHPVRDRRDPRNPGKELTCASCHNPHGAPNKDLLFYEGEIMPGFCKSCHKF